MRKNQHLEALITGAGGFTSRHLARRLKDEGCFHVIGLDLLPEPPKDIELDAYFCADLTDSMQLSEVISQTKPDLVFNLAGLSSGPAETIYRVNVLGTICLLEALKIHARNARILLIGSSAEYGYVETSRLPVDESYTCAPVGPNGVSKHAATLIGVDYARRLNMKVVVARPFNLIGAGIPSTLVVGAVLCRLKRTMLSSSEASVKVGNTSALRDFVDVGDAVNAYVNMVRGEFWGEVFNICSGRALSIRDILSQLFANAEYQIRTEVDPELVRSGEIPILYGSWQKANRAFDFEPKMSIEESLRAAWRYTIGGVAE